MNQFLLHPDRFFSPDPAVRQLARELYEPVASLPIVSPHGHVDPRLFADPDFQFGSPTELFLIPDHYVFRMLYSQGYALEALGIPPQDDSQTEDDHRKIWQIFAENFKLFRGTPTGIWIREALTAVFHIHEKLTPANAQTIYDQINAKLQGPDFTPRRLYERFNIETFCTTDAATDPLSFHQASDSGIWLERPYPTHLPSRCCYQPDPCWLERGNNVPEPGFWDRSRRLCQFHRCFRTTTRLLQSNGRKGY